MATNAEKQTVFNYETQQEVVIGSKDAQNLIQGIVSVRGRIPEMGFYSPNLTKNIVVNFRGSTYNAISKDVFVEKFLVFDNNNGTYGYHAGQDNITQIRTFSTHKGQGRFPYHTISREYNSQNNLERFGVVAKATHVINSKNKSLIPFTFGLEYETSRGYIPEELCYSKGLIPLRDGSITGIEYASIVLDASKQGFELLKEQLDVLRNFTEYDKECSLHIHFGGFPVSQKAIATLYILAVNLQQTIQGNQIVPRYTFNTAAYKASGKEYCKLLPAKDKFDTIYRFLSGETPYLGSLTVAHPGDQRHDQKWNVHSRYYWMNLINMCFYQSPKTVEMRFLRPSYNFNKIVNWIFIFNAIMQYAIDFSKNNKYMTDEVTYQTMKKMFTGEMSDFEKVFKAVYTKEISAELMGFLENLRTITRKQDSLKDSIGAIDKFDDPIITRSVLDL